MKNIGTVVIYKLEGLNQIERDNFCRGLLGRTVKTHGGKYTHHVEGLLDSIPHIRVARGVIIVEQANKQKISDFLKEQGVREVFMRDLILMEEDIRWLMKDEDTR